MSTLSISVTDKVTPELKSILRRVNNPTPGLQIAGRKVANLLRAHYRKLEKTKPNELKGKRTHFWRGVVHAVNKPVSSGKNAVKVSISHPAILQKIKGGTIRAKSAKRLTIPIHPKAHGRRASVLANELGIELFAVKGVLAATGKDGQLTAYYALKKSVTQKPDPDALPEQKEIESTAIESFAKWIRGRNNS